MQLFLQKNKKYQDEITVYQKEIEHLKRQLQEKDETIQQINRRGADRLSVLKSYAEGDFSGNIEQQTGEYVAFNEVFDDIQQNLLNISNSVEEMIVAIDKGDLRYRLDSAGYQGQWKQIIDRLNTVFSTFAEPVDECRQVMTAMARGDFSAQMKSVYQGDIAELAKWVNSTNKVLASYVSEVNAILSSVSNKNLTAYVKRHYTGDFTSLRESINSTVALLNQIIREIAVSGAFISSEVGKITEASQEMAGIVIQQKTEVEALNQSIANLIELEKGRAEGRKASNQVLELAVKSVDQGSESMKKMLIDMGQINQASKEIDKIIKVIDDIAFQTNLLALNAAVEAARAGEHGRGFAVVAEEVRNLAAKSKASAINITEIIETSVQLTKQGSETATHTAEILAKMVAQLNEVREISESLSTSNQIYADRIAIIETSTKIIAQEANQVANKAEENASTAEEINSQTHVLQKIIKGFRLNA